jgi:predicted nucleotidyltransferase component of viral defense system
MIDIVTVKKLTTQYQTTNLNIIREYCQHLFLSYFYQRRSSSRVLFKGGTALRFIYKSPRFSEDLDFTATAITKSGLEDAVQDTLMEVERFGIDTTLTEFEPTSGGYIVIVNFQLLGHDISIQLNLSSRKIKTTKGEVVLIANDFVPAYNLIQLSEDLLIAEKIKAVLHRAKPRDYFDLYFILRSNLLPPQKRTVLSQIVDKLNQEKYNFAIGLKNFLPVSHQRLIKDFSSILRKELKRFL